MKKYFQNFWKDTVLLFRNLPGTVVALFVIAVVTMNLLANKIIYRGPYLAIDGGILVSWLSFLCMDIITKHYGPRAANKVSIFAIMVNLLMCLIFYIISIMINRINVLVDILVIRHPPPAITLAMILFSERF